MLKNDIENFVKEYEASKGRKETNVLYLTSNCNFDCDYCFEKINREKLQKQVNITYKQIDSFLDDIEWREEGLNSTIVLFGGEPLLMIDKMEYVVNSMVEREKSGGWGWIVTTNGYLLKNKDIKNRVLKLLSIKGPKNSITGALQISFDASGQHKRKLHNKTENTFDYIYDVLKELDDEGIKYQISYTISSGNIETYKTDIIWILNKLKNIERLTVNVARSEIEKSVWKTDKIYDEFVKKLELFCLAVYSKYKIPICSFSCEMCRLCDKQEVGNNYLIPSKENPIKENKFVKKDFNKF